MYQYYCGFKGVVAGVSFTWIHACINGALCIYCEPQVRTLLCKLMYDFGIRSFDLYFLYTHFLLWVWWSGNFGLCLYLLSLGFVQVCMSHIQVLPCFLFSFLVAVVRWNATFGLQSPGYLHKKSSVSEWDVYLVMHV